MTPVLVMGSDKSHFNVSLIVRDKVKQDSVHRPQFLKRKESRSGFEPRSFCMCVCVCVCVCACVRACVRACVCV